MKRVQLERSAESNSISEHNIYQSDSFSNAGHNSVLQDPIFDEQQNVPSNLNEEILLEWCNVPSNLNEEILPEWCNVPSNLNEEILPDRCKAL